MKMHRNLFLVVGGVGLLWSGCQTNNSDDVPVAQVTIPKVAGAALHEMVAYQMRSHDWGLLRNERDQMLFERLVRPWYQFWSAVGEKSTVVSQARVSFSEVPGGTLLQGMVQRVDNSQRMPSPKPENPRELHAIFQQVRQMAGDNLTNPPRR